MTRHECLETPLAAPSIACMSLHDDRRRLMLASVLLLGIVAIGALALIGARKILGIDAADVKEVLAIIFPTISALAAGAAAFYFRGGR